MAAMSERESYLQERLLEEVRKNDELRCENERLRHAYAEPPVLNPRCWYDD